jgi:hypothetical protein
MWRAFVRVLVWAMSYADGELARSARRNVPTIEETT